MGLQYYRIISHYASNIIPSFNWSKLYMDPYTMLQVSNVLTYLYVIVLKTICMIRDALMKFSKPGMYR